MMGSRRGDIFSTCVFNNMMGSSLTFNFPRVCLGARSGEISLLSSTIHDLISSPRISPKHLCFHPHDGIPRQLFSCAPGARQRPSPSPLRLAQRQGMLSIEFSRSFLPVGINLRHPGADFLPVGNVVAKVGTTRPRPWPVALTFRSAPNETCQPVTLRADLTREVATLNDGCRPATGRGVKRCVPT